MHIAALVFIDIAIIMIVARLFGRLAIKVGQPPVVGEILAGIALGPSLLGLLPGDLDGRLFPPDVLPYLNILAQLGLVLFMFIVGLELDMLLIRGREFVIVERAGGYPGEFGATQGLRFIVLPVAAKKLQVNGLLSVIMRHHFDARADVHFDAQFLTQFADEACLESLVRFSFASRELPESAQVHIIEAAGDQQFAIAEN